MPTPLAFVTDVGSIQRILAYLGEPARAPRIAPAAWGPPPFEKHFHPDARTHPSERAASESQGQGVALIGALRTQRQDVAGQSTDGCLTALHEYEFDQGVSW